VLAISTGDTTIYSKAGDLVSVSAKMPEDASIKFGYWNAFPSGVLDPENIRNPNPSFEMPETDVVLKAIFARQEIIDGKIIVIADIIEDTNTDDWVPTTTGDAEIEALRDQNGITISAAKLDDESFAAFETDVSPNANQNDSIVIGYEIPDSGVWRLYLNIPGIPYAEGYFVELKPCGEELEDVCEEKEQSIFAKVYNANGEVSISSITRTFSISDFKNEIGEAITESENLNKVTSMGFAKVGGDPEESTISISSLSFYMSELNSGGGGTEIACLAFDDVVITRWNNTFTVINNPLYTPEGYTTFSDFVWFRYNEEIGEGQSWSAGPNGEPIPPGVYRVEMKASDTKAALRSCDKTIESSSPPAKISGELLKRGDSEIYDIKGRRIANPIGNRVLIQKNKNGTGRRLP
jgi:hypothetical protein